MYVQQLEGNDSLAQLIKERRSVRLFKSEPIPEQIVLELLNVAIWAPNHGNRQPWRFIMYREEGRAVLARAVRDTFGAEEREKFMISKFDYFLQIPIHLVVVLQEDPRQRQWEEDFAAVCCLIQNFQLAAWEQGIGVVWKSNPFIYDPKLRTALGVQAGEKIIAILHVGYPEAVPPIRPRIPAEEKLTIIDSDL